MFTPTGDWCRLPEPEYQQRKTEMLNLIQAELNRWLSLEDDAWLHAELATPRGFAGWTGRPNGMVGGLGQHPAGSAPSAWQDERPCRGFGSAATASIRARAQRG